MRDGNEFIGNDTAKIERVIHELYPNLHKIHHIDHGYENHIVVIDNLYAVRFPRNKGVWQRTELEKYILSQLNSPLSPKVIRSNTSPAYLILTLLPGKHMYEDEFRQLPVSTQQKIGRQIAEFAHSLHNTIDVNDFNDEHAKLRLIDNGDGTYGDYLKEMLYEFKFPTKEQDKTAKSYFKKWQSITPSKSVVVHDDLHIHNLLIENGELSGVLDFAAACIGTPEQELRQIYRLSDTALLAAVETYNRLADTVLDIEVSRIWATTQELAAYARELKANRTSGLAYKRAFEHLSLWFPDVFNQNAS